MLKAEAINFLNCPTRQLTSQTKQKNANGKLVNEMPVSSSSMVNRKVPKQLRSLACSVKGASSVLLKELRKYFVWSDYLSIHILVSGNFQWKNFHDVILKECFSLWYFLSFQQWYSKMRLSGEFQVCLVFLRKDFALTKTHTSKH